MWVTLAGSWLMLLSVAWFDGFVVLCSVVWLLGAWFAAFGVACFLLLWFCCS